MSRSVQPDPVQMEYEVIQRPDRWELKDTDNVPDTVLQDVDVRRLVLILEWWIEREGRDATVGSNIALRWDPKHRGMGVDPDVYLVEPKLPPDATSLLLWEPGRKPPRLAVEIVSVNTAEVDYLDKPERYAASGTRELWIFDPLRFGPSTTLLGGPHVLQVWRRVAKGRFKRVYAGDGPAYSRELAAWIVVTNEGRELRIAYDRAGTRLWPTRAEAAEQAQREEAEAREAAEKAREAAEKAREAAERQVAVEREAREKAERKARTKATKAARDASFQTLRELYGRRLGRSLTDEEVGALRERLARLGADRVGAALFEFEGAALAAWLLRNDAT